MAGVMIFGVPNHGFLDILDGTGPKPLHLFRRRPCGHEPGHFAKVLRVLGVLQGPGRLVRMHLILPQQHVAQLVSQPLQHPHVTGHAHDGQQKVRAQLRPVIVWVQLPRERGVGLADPGGHGLERQPGAVVDQGIPGHFCQRVIIVCHDR